MRLVSYGVSKTNSLSVEQALSYFTVNHGSYNLEKSLNSLWSFKSTFLFIRS